MQPAREAGKPVGQQMGIGSDVRLEKGPEFGACRGRQHGDAGVASDEAMLAFDGMPVLSFLFFGTGTFSMAAATRLLSGFFVLRPGAVLGELAAELDRLAAREANHPKAACALLASRRYGRYLATDDLGRPHLDPASCGPQLQPT